ncbi:MAG TPA: tRNA (adenosine(37)-N6)-threonylcarbamoyltransferase complex transferase subunit TsaD [Patescibacteria group bacterium]
MLILAIETSCDETSASLLDINSKKINVLSHIVSSQSNIHQKYGGVVPEVAARSHVLRIIPTVQQALGRQKKLDLIVVTAGPGLITSLLVGVQTALGLGLAWDVPVLGVNHLEGHILSNWLTPTGKTPNIKFPALCLIVSGGHTLLVLMKKIGDYKIIGQTRDDAAGEAFDKIAKILGLKYPGGPIISQLARQGNPDSFKMPRPMLHDKNFDFSFSGLKTSVLYKVRDLALKKQIIKKRTKPLNKSKKKGQIVLNKKTVYDLCASFQEAVVDVLTAKTIKAAGQYKVKTIMLSGGVSANNLLRERLRQLIKDQLPKTDYLIPDQKYTGDNATMIGVAGYYNWQTNKQKSLKIKVNPNLKL